MSKVSLGQKKSAHSSKQVEFELRTRIKELELEVKTLKSKHEELRKAKNTMLIKKEKEFVSTGIPQRSNNSNSSGSLNQVENSVLDALKREHAAEMEKLTDQIKRLTADAAVAAKSEDCGHQEIITALQTQMAEMESLNTALSLQCNQLQQKLDEAYGQISQKEAEHYEAQGKMRNELQKKWQEMYKEWMRTTEAKIAELQAANDMLRRMLGGPS